jgi:hypothetical protein
LWFSIAMTKTVLMGTASAADAEKPDVAAAAASAMTRARGPALCIF